MPSSTRGILFFFLSVVREIACASSHSPSMLALLSYKPLVGMGMGISPCIFFICNFGAVGDEDELFGF